MLVSQNGIPRLDLGEAFQEINNESTRWACDRVLVPLPVNKKAGTLKRTLRTNMLKRNETIRAEKGAYNRVTTQLAELEYACKEYGLEEPLDDGERDNYISEFDAEMAILNTLDRGLRQEQELRAKNLLFDTGTFTGAQLFTDFSGSPWDNSGTDIPAQIITTSEIVRSNCGMAPNTLLVGAKTLANMLQNTKIIARFPGAPMVTKSMLLDNLKEVLGVEKLVVGDAVYHDGIDAGDTFVPVDIWPDDYAQLCVTAPDGDRNMRTPCIGRSVYWSQQSNEDALVEMYREDQTRSWVYRSRNFRQEKIWDKYFGHLLKIDVI